MASGKNVAMTSRKLKTLSLESSTGKNNSNKKRDFIMWLLFEIVADIMKYLEPYELWIIQSINSMDKSSIGIP